MYTFKINSTLTEEVRADLIKAETFSEYEDYFYERYSDTPYWGLAVMEAENIDIELNLGEYGSEYFICAKDDDGEWQSLGYVSDYFAPEAWSYVNVDFEDDDWKEQLEKEMTMVLNQAERRLIWMGANLNR